MLAKLTGAKQLTLPDELLTSFPGMDCFNVSEEGGRIVLTPVCISRVAPVRRKLAELGVTEEDVRDAVAWARRRDATDPASDRAGHEHTRLRAATELIRVLDYPKFRLSESEREP